MQDPVIFWAKSSPFRSLSEHMIETGKCVQLLVKAGTADSVFYALQNWWQLSSEEALGLIGFFAAAHDMGKCHPLFQAKCMELACVKSLEEAGMIHPALPKDKITGFRHELYSAELLKHLLEDYGVCEELISGLCRITSLHHQGKARRMELRLPSACQPQKWKEAQAGLLEELISVFKPPLQKLREAENIDAVLQELLGLIILADWITSGELLSAEPYLERAIERRGLETKKEELPSGMFSELWPEIPENSLRGIQQAAEEICKEEAPRFCLIEAPMGEGKSEAAVYFAAAQMKKYKKTGIYIAMPTAATGNQMYFRLNRLLTGHGFPQSRLLHSMAWLVDDQTPEALKTSDRDNSETNETASQWLAPARRGLLSQFAVGTVDQVMMSVMNVRYGALRLLGLSNKVLILDEIHAYDTYMQTIIERLIRWCSCMDVPLVLLSASLPLYKKRSLLEAYGADLPGEYSREYPVITTVSGNGKIGQILVDRVHMHRTYAMSVRPFLEEDRQTALLAAHTVEKGGCLCVLVNTVKRAQSVYTELKNSDYDGELLLFHARFPAERRQSIEKTVTALFGRKNNKNRPKKCIVISTQVMEQSLDVDFDAMLTDLAPIDLLLQRMGRVHRFDDTSRPEAFQIPRITVLTGTDLYQHSVYASTLMVRTEELIRNKESIRTPDEIRSLIETVYREEAPEEIRQYEIWAQEQFNASFEAAEAQAVLLPMPGSTHSFLSDGDPELWHEDEEESVCRARTRLGTDTVRLAFLSPEETAQLPRRPERKQARDILMKSVSVRTDHLGDPPDTAVKGEGLLSGTWLLPAENGIYRWGGYLLINDPELGILVKKEEKNEI